MPDILWGRPGASHPRHAGVTTAGRIGRWCRCAARAGEVEHERRHGVEADAPLRLLGIDLAREGMPAARLVECEIVAARRTAARTGPPRGRAWSAPRRRARGWHSRGRGNPRGSQTPPMPPTFDLAPVPGDGAEVDADMADKSAAGFPRRLDQHAQIGMGPFDVTPWQFLDDVVGPDRVHQRFDCRPRCVPVQDVDFDTHCSCPMTLCFNAL